MLDVTRCSFVGIVENGYLTSAWIVLGILHTVDTLFIIVIFKWFNIKLLFTLQRYDDYVGYENENSYT